MSKASRTSSPVLNDVKQLYLDFDSFFATAEQFFNPALRGKPVGVVPLDSPHTGCIAISKEAKAAGVKGSASIKEARAFLPGMIFVVARPDAYVRLHHRILAVIETCLPVAKVRSIDELVCHLLPSEAREAEALANRIKTALAENFSPQLTCSIGIAKTELLAKIGAELNKPDGFTLLRGTDLPKRLEQLKLSKIPGISEGMKARLRAADINNFLALWDIGPKHARAIWGSVEGERFWNGLHGFDVERPEATKRMFGHSRMLPTKWRTHEKVHVCARQLALSATRRLRRADRRASRLTFGVRAERLSSSKSVNKAATKWACEIPFLPARDDQTILEALSQAVTRYRHEVTFSPRSVSVMLHGLEQSDAVQQDLFASLEDIAGISLTLEAKAKRDRLSDTMDKLRALHGPAAVSFGPKVEMPGGYLGAKIAFGRIPDAADFSEAPTKDEETHFCRL